MLNIGPQELLVILVIALLVVGPQRLPELGRSIGRWMKELRQAQDEVKRTIRVGLNEPNGDASTRSGTGTGDPTTGPQDEAANGRALGVQSPTPTAGTSPTADEVRDISRSLGKSLGQIRRAREEVQRSFRVDLDAPGRKPSPAHRPPNPRPTDAGKTEPAADEPIG
jgi:sec-independent protein translocase protein TatA